MPEPLVAVYLRVSTHSQNEAGQREAISAWLRGSGVLPERVLWFTDQQTGDHMKRPGFERLQEAVCKGKVGTVVVFKLDRLSRKLRDGIGTLCDWCERGIRVVSVTQQLDFSGTVGRLVASVLFAVAEMEQETRRERQAVGIAVAKREGKYRGRKPGTTKASPDRAKELRERGYSMEEIGKALGVSKMAVSRYLKQGASHAVQRGGIGPEACAGACGPVGGEV
jgi:DNA invertase Pin-like site-specific DNA recombinase